ncbi:MAG: macro domain-containing protein [Anaerolineales bacterium]
MENKYAGKKCFVIMPFGKKTDLEGNSIDFDVVYQSFIKEAVEGVGMECERCDEIIDTGSIHFKMFHGIFEADVAVVDVTTLNANVFYELGIRHALNRCVTLIIRKAGSPIPFNINDLTAIDYNLDTPEHIKKSKETIREFIKNGLDKQNVDSLVHQALDDLKIERKSKKIEKKELYSYSLSNVQGKEIGIITGDIQNIKEVDVWVNSENTNMQMARHFDRSISGTIRYMGAKKDVGGNIEADLIADELNALVKGKSVAAGIVIPTGSGELLESNNVKKIFHAASVEGQVGLGYSPIKDLGECFRNWLELIDSKKLASEEIKSILFPLMGTGTTKLDPLEVTRQLIDAALSYIEENPKTKVQQVFFLAYNKQDFDVCKNIFENDKRITVQKPVD